MAPDLLISSDLRRAIDTADIVGAATGLPVKLDPRLRETHLGDWQGRTVEEIERDVAGRDRDLALRSRMGAAGRGVAHRRGAPVPRRWSRSWTSELPAVRGRHRGAGGARRDDRRAGQRPARAADSSAGRRSAASATAGGPRWPAAPTTRAGGWSGSTSAPERDGRSDLPDRLARTARLRRARRRGDRLDRLPARRADRRPRHPGGAAGGPAGRSDRPRGRRHRRGRAVGRAGRPASRRTDLPAGRRRVRRLLPAGAGRRGGRGGLGAPVPGAVRHLGVGAAGRRRGRSGSGPGGRLAGDRDGPRVRGAGRGRRRRGGRCRGAAVEAAAAEVAARCRMFFSVDTLDRLRRGGRIGAAAAVARHRARGEAAAARRRRAGSCRWRRCAPPRGPRSGWSSWRCRRPASDPVDLAVHHLAAADAGRARSRRGCGERIPQAARLLVSEVGAVIGAHVGPGVAGRRGGAPPDATG